MAVLVSPGAGQTLLVGLIHPALEQGRLAVITGGANGIGLACARRFASLGMTVCLIDSSAQSLEIAAGNLAGEATSYLADVSDRASVERVAGEIVDRHGAPAVLMNNAGVGGGGDALSNPQGWDRLIGVNLLGVLHGVQAFVPEMVERGDPGIVINTGSKQGITTPPGDTAYNVSKAGVKALTEGLEYTLGEQTQGRVSAHLLIPGFTYTEMIARRIPDPPAAAWTAEQVADRLMDGLARRQFYILCQDNETTREQDERRIMWSALDIIEDRPPLSRWHPEWREAFLQFERTGKRD